LEATRGVGCGVEDVGRTSYSLECDTEV
jgi:hypothetical protein